jgi:glycosyltransferase involved in cell wall biosynthesis
LTNIQLSVSKPIISVIITAYNRKRYLQEAICSVLNQTISKDLYEIVVVKNFSWEHDEQYHRMGVNILNVEEPSLGRKICLALQASHGDIIAILNDDDL